MQVFRNLKRQPIGTVIELDSPSPMKRPRSNIFAAEAIPNPDSLPGMEVEPDMEDDFPAVGKADDDLELALEALMDENET